MDSAGLLILSEKPSLEIASERAKCLPSEDLSSNNSSPLPQGAETKACSSEEQSPDDVVKLGEQSPDSPRSAGKAKKNLGLLNDDAELFRLSEMIDPVKSLRHAMSLQIFDGFRRSIKEKSLTFAEDITQKVNRQNSTEPAKEKDFDLDNQASDVSNELSDPDEKKECSEKEEEEEEGEREDHISKDKIANPQSYKVEELNETDVHDENVGKIKTII